MPTSLLTRPLLLVVTAAALFGLCNVAWRLGEGQALALAATRAAVGVVLFGPLVVSVFRCRGRHPLVVPAVFRTTVVAAPRPRTGVVATVRAGAGGTVGNRASPSRWEAEPSM